MPYRLAFVVDCSPPVHYLPTKVDSSPPTLLMNSKAMPARRPVRPSPQTTSPKPATTNRLFQGSTSSWFQEWRKGREKTNDTPAPAADQPKDEAADAVARWLMGEAESR